MAPMAYKTFSLFVIVYGVKAIAYIKEQKHPRRSVRCSCDGLWPDKGASPASAKVEHVQGPLDQIPQVLKKTLLLLSSLDSLYSLSRY